MTITKTDCRSDVGVTVGLIDGIIAMARVLRTKDQSSEEVQEALKDLRADEDVAALLGLSGRMTPDEAYAEWSKFFNKNGWEWSRGFAIILFGYCSNDERRNYFVEIPEEECYEIIKALPNVVVRKK